MLLFQKWRSISGSASGGAGTGPGGAGIKWTDQETLTLIELVGKEGPSDRDAKAALLKSKALGPLRTGNALYHKVSDPLCVPIL